VSFAVLAVVLVGTGLYGIISYNVTLVFASSRVLASLLYGVKPLDSIAVTAAILGMVAVGLVAAFLPARRAANADPMRALRYE